MTRDPAGKRAQIIQAARTVFCQEGFAPARIESIALLAKVAKGSVYAHIDSKEELLMEAVLLFLTDRRTRIEAALAIQAEADPWLALRRMVTFLLTEIPDHSGAQARLLVDLWSVARVKPELLATVTTRMQELESHWEGVLTYMVAVAVARGRMRPCDPQGFSKLITTAIHGCTLQATFQSPEQGLLRATSLTEVLFAGLALGPEQKKA